MCKHQEVHEQVAGTIDTFASRRLEVIDQTNQNQIE